MSVSELQDLLRSSISSILETQSDDPGVFHLVIDTASSVATTALGAAVEKLRAIENEIAAKFADSLEAALTGDPGTASDLAVSKFEVWSLVLLEVGLQVERPADGTIGVAVLSNTASASFYSLEKLKELGTEAAKLKPN